MEQKAGESLKSHDNAAELKAVVEARRELGPELEDHLLAAFLGRIQQQVDQRVAEDLAKQNRAQVSSSAKGGKRGDDVPDVAIAASTFALAIPIVVVAGIFGGVGGIWAVMIALVLVNMLYLIDRWK